MKAFIIVALLCSAFAYALGQGVPALSSKNGCHQLIVDKKPFLILGGELGNSSASDIGYMKPVWPKLKKMNLNTLVTPVYWDLIEPREGRFNFVLVDNLISNARKNQLKLVLLWFGTWKNSMSCYAPEWVKTADARFPRARAVSGQAQEILTPFSTNALNADKKAFVALMRHISKIDSKRHTVLMVQVENEIGMLPDARDHCRLADDAFEAAVPAKLITYLASHKNMLNPDLSKRWQENGYKTAGNWEAVFGKGLATDELFMGWYFATFANEVAKAGKAVYPIPMYVNAALNRPGKKPGEYPSAGPLPHLVDVWKAAASAIDMLSPDFYNPDFKYWNDLYARPDNALFIPEHRFEAGIDAKAFYAIGHYGALGFSPFSIESATNPGQEAIGKAYAILHQLAPEIAKAKKRGTLEGVLLDKRADSVQIDMGAYRLTVSHELTLGWSQKAKDADWPLVGGVIIGLSDDSFFVAGTGLVVTFRPRETGQRAGLLSVEEGKLIDGKWQQARRLNGDQDHQGRHVRIPVGEYGIQRIKLYTYR